MAGELDEDNLTALDVTIDRIGMGMGEMSDKMKELADVSCRVLSMDPSRAVWIWYVGSTHSSFENFFRRPNRLAGR